MQRVYVSHTHTFWRAWGMTRRPQMADWCQLGHAETKAKMHFTSCNQRAVLTPAHSLGTVLTPFDACKAHGKIGWSEAKHHGRFCNFWWSFGEISVNVSLRVCPSLTGQAYYEMVESELILLFPLLLAAKSLPFLLFMLLCRKGRQRPCCQEFDHGLPAPDCYTDYVRKHSQPVWKGH